MFLEQLGYNGFLWPTHCISFSWSLLLLWLPSLLLWNIPTHYLQPECVCKCSPTSGSAHFSLPALKKIHQSLSLKDDASSGNKTCSGSRSHHKRRAGSVKGHYLSPQSSFQAHTTWRVMGDKTCYCYPSQARLTRRSWVCDENFSSPWDQSCRSRKTDTDCWVTGSGLRYWVAAATTLWHRWLRGLLCMSCMASTPYLYSKHKAIFSAVSKLRCITWPPYFTLLSCRVFGCSSSWDWG